MEQEEQPVCPVCTLYLRPGINLKQHLSTHPKQKVIEALIRVSDTKPCPTNETQQVPPPWMPPNSMYSNFGNHSFIYQQFMSSSTPQNNILNINPQLVTIPTVLNSQMMGPPYVYQQQQVIMSSGPSIMPILPTKHLPIELPTVAEEIEENTEESEVREDVEDVEMEEAEKKNEEADFKLEETHAMKFADVNNEFSGEIDDPISPEFDSSELNKSCQTNYDNQTQEAFFSESADEPNSSYTILRNTYDETDNSYTITSNYNPITSNHTPITSNHNPITSKNDEEVVTARDMEDMDGMNLFIDDNPFGGHTVSQVEDFELSHDRARVLMNIGDNFSSREESVSRESANIRADEHMPPRGELSGQESNDMSETWNHPRYEKISVVPYDLIAGENWSDEVSTDRNRDFNETDDTPTVSGFREPPITYKCPTCHETFACPRERKRHQTEHHKPRESTRKVKKLTIKPKKSDVKTNFDNVFTNQLKIETETSPKIENTPSLKDSDKKEDVHQIHNPVICTLCDVVVPDNAALKEHQVEIHNLAVDLRHKCKICEATFPTELRYNEHLQVHPLECRLCGRLFYRKQNMQLHMKRHLGIKPYKCLICEKSFVTKQKHDEHKNTHTGEAPLKCADCDETFKRHSNLVQHRNRHHLNVKRKFKDYVCFCGEVFHSKRKLAWHKEIHDPKPKCCLHCSEKFIHMSSLTRHIRRAHNDRYLPGEERESENVECPICKRIYLKSYLEVHIRNHSGQKPFTCLICNKTFTTNWNLKLHKWTHASRTSKPFKCELCKGAFIREPDYIAHMNAHKNVKPYTCNYCGAQFIRKYNCQRHVKEHQKQKTYSCDICDKTFHRSYYLKDHLRVHSGDRPFACHICGKASTTKSNHNKHIRIHHAREPVSDKKDCAPPPNNTQVILLTDNTKNTFDKTNNIKT